MSHEVQQIPPTPRRVLWRAALAHRWPLAFVGFMLFVYGGLWTLMLFFHSQGKHKDDTDLDVAASLCSGTVFRTEQIEGRIGGKRVERVHYTFTVPSSGTLPALGPQVSDCLAEVGRYAQDATVEVEYLPDRPQTNRIAGERIDLLGDWVSPSVRISVLPGFLILLLYFTGALRFRHVLRHGDVAVAHVTGVRHVRFVLPEMLSVDYEFRDHRARWRSAWHWVREHSELGGRLREGAHELPVVHHRMRPWQSRLVEPGQFKSPVSLDVRLELPAENDG